MAGTQRVKDRTDAPKVLAVPRSWRELVVLRPGDSREGNRDADPEVPQPRIELPWRGAHLLLAGVAVAAFAFGVGLRVPAGVASAIALVGLGVLGLVVRRIVRIR